MEEGTQLPRGRGVDAVVRIGATVRRPTGPWTPTIHSYLEYLDRAGFRGVPRPLGVDEEGREILTYIEGDVFPDDEWAPGDHNLWPESLRSLETLAATGVLLRELHEASSGFVPHEPIWREHDPIGCLPGEIVCHGDIGQHNTVYRDGIPVAFIDWDGAMPNLPMLEFAAAAWQVIPLGEDRKNRNAGFPIVEEVPERIACFARAYGARADGVMWALQETLQRGTEKLRYWPIDAAGAAEALDRTATSLRWLDANRELIIRALD